MLANMRRFQALDLAADGRRARRLFSAALMSDTKWRRLFEAVQSGRGDLKRMTVKFINMDEPRPMRFPPSLEVPRPYVDTIEFGPIALRSIEWIEFAGDLTGMLQSIGRFPTEIREGRTRVVGYTHRSASVR
ncbi:hypothetical protein J8J14_00055 [Roseomonas sp. SSH11]|uniref:Uncharacterized protein n=1 Tax=Pararoseomonas baculiformis TaxID=2820812 RepID=A0ABS4A8F3_9PROT|nr:hypothetical protein [Pararoseomonas baculiformis]MBP0443156.1 hypothetical protein [Pararoseomonas baculiformis]